MSIEKGEGGGQEGEMVLARVRREASADERECLGLSSHMPRLGARQQLVTPRFPARLYSRHGLN